MKLQAPDLSVKPSDSVYAGVPVTLTCRRTDNETGISVEYFHNINNVRDSGSAPTTELIHLFSLNPTKASDTGKYECSVQVNGLSSNLSNEIDLKVKGELSALQGVPQKKG